MFFDYWKEMYVWYEDWINNFMVCFIFCLDIREYDFIKDLDLIELIVEKVVCFL